jgi:hypothetical protein
MLKVALVVVILGYVGLIIVMDLATTTNTTNWNGMIVSVATIIIPLVFAVVILLLLFGQNIFGGGKQGL